MYFCIQQWRVFSSFMNFQINVPVSDLPAIEMCFVFEGGYSACVSVSCFKPNKQQNQQTKPEEPKHNSNEENFIFHFLHLIKISPLQNDFLWVWHHHLISVFNNFGGFCSQKKTCLCCEVFPLEIWEGLKPPVTQGWELVSLLIPCSTSPIQ